MFKVQQGARKFESGWEDSEQSYSWTVDGLRWRINNHPRFWRPPMDVYETDQALVIRLEIAGMSEEAFQIIHKGRFLSITGIRSDFPERRAFHQMEIPFGEFMVELELPIHVDRSQIQAVYQQGFLKVTLPKKLPRHIQIEDDN